MQAIDSSQEIGSFLNSVLHDLRAVQRAIGISAEILLNMEVMRADPHAEQNLQRLLEGVGKMNALLDGLSSYSMSLSAAKYAFGPFPSEIALRMALADLDREILETGASVNYSLLPEVFGDRERLSCVFRNLIGNALKYHRAEPPRINIQAKQSSDSWIFSVEDNGAGIDHKYWKELFVPFHRLHGSEIPGVGLGLAICKNVVQAHHGSIWLESTVGTGTTFLFTLPLSDRDKCDGP